MLTLRLIDVPASSNLSHFAFDSLVGQVPLMEDRNVLKTSRKY